MRRDQVFLLVWLEITIQISFSEKQKRKFQVQTTNLVVEYKILKYYLFFFGSLSVLLGN